MSNEDLLKCVNTNTYNWQSSNRSQCSVTVVKQLDVKYDIVQQTRELRGCASIRLLSYYVLTHTQVIRRWQPLPARQMDSIILNAEGKIFNTGRYFHNWRQCKKLFMRRIWESFGLLLVVYHIISSLDIFYQVY